MTLILTESEVEQLIGFDDVAESIDLIDAAYRDKAAGRASLHPRCTIQFPSDGGYYSGNAMRFLPGILPDRDSAAIRAYPLSHETQIEESGPRVLDYTMGQEVLLYYRYSKGMELAAIMADRRIMNMRTAAPTGVATNCLAREDSTVLAVIGAGRHAPWQVAAVCAVRPITDVRVFSPTQNNRERLARELDASLDASVQAVDSARSAVDGADVVITVTNANRPVIEGEWLRDGAHVNVIARGEVDEDTLCRADVLACSWREQILRDTPEFLPVPEMIRRGDLREEDFIDIDDVLTDPSSGRTSDTNLTVFLSQGVGIWDAAFAPWVYARAIERGVGLDLRFDQ